MSLTLADTICLSTWNNHDNQRDPVLRFLETQSWNLNDWKWVQLSQKSTCLINIKPWAHWFTTDMSRSKKKINVSYERIENIERYYVPPVKRTYFHWIQMVSIIALSFKSPYNKRAMLSSRSIHLLFLSRRQFLNIRPHRY